MRLLDLQPRWVIHEPERRWLLFKSPVGHGYWLTCKNFPMSISDQLRELYRLCPDLVRQPIVPCKAETVWRITGEFENLCIIPSLDASPSGNWHGCITNGVIS